MLPPLNGSANYTISLSKTGFFTTNDTISHTENEFVTGYTYALPSLNLTYYDLADNSILTDVYTLFDGESNYFEENVTTGNFFDNNMTADYYRIVPQKTGYASNNYYINLSPSTAGFIDAYLVSTTGSNEITLTVQDTSLIAVPDALVSVFFRNGTNLKLVATGLTSVIGKTSFTLDPDYTHTFFIEAEGYSTKTFNYLPT